MFSEEQKMSVRLRMAYLLLLCSLMLGGSAAYAAFGIMVIAGTPFLKAESVRFWGLRFLRITSWFWGILLLYCLIFVAAIVFGGYADPGEIGELKWVAILIGLILPSFAILEKPLERREEKILAKVFLGLLVISVVVGVVQVSFEYDYVRTFLFADKFTMGGRPSGLLSNPIPFGQLMGAIFLISLAGYLVLIKDISVKGSCFLFFLLVVSFLGLILSESRGAWLALVLTTGLSFFYTSAEAKRRWKKWILLVGGIGVLTMVVSPEIRSRVASGFDASEDSNRVRLELWRANWQVLKEHPFGVGYGGNDLLVEEEFLKLGYERHDSMWHSHNEFVEIAVGAGWLGLILYFLMSVFLMIVGIKEYRRFLRMGDEWKAFVVMSSVLIHSFIQFCALTDQTNTQGRFLLCMAWAISLAAYSLNRVYFSSKDQVGIGKIPA